MTKVVEQRARYMILHDGKTKVEETPMRLFYKQVMEIVGDDFSGQLYQIYNGRLKLDTGSERFTHPELPGYYWSTDEGIRKRIKKEGITDYSAIKYKDTRLSIRKVAIILDKAERAVWQLENPEQYQEWFGDSDKPYGTNYWDEGGIDVAPNMLYREDGIGPNSPWPQRRWTYAYVVHGGSEGYWLHVESQGTDVKGQKWGSEMLLLAKSLGNSWERCYESAGRISYMLQWEI